MLRALTNPHAVIYVTNASGPNPVADTHRGGRNTDASWAPTGNREPPSELSRVVDAVFIPARLNLPTS